jgi:hypothetical protein
MKTLLKIAVILIAMVGFSNGTFAQDTESANASATIVTPISITWVQDMEFGNIAVTSTAGTVALNPDGSRTPAGGVTLPNVTGNPVQAVFTINGTASYTYAITLPLTLTITNTTAGPGLGQTMTVNNFTSDPSGTGQLDIGGAQTLNVGATVNVSAAQAAGHYESAAPFDVTVNYN